MSSEKPQMGNWYSGFDWFLTIKDPTFFSVQGEVIYLFLILPLHPSWLVLKLILAVIGISVISKLIGYDLKELWLRIRRWHLGKKRHIYSPKQNYQRYKTGI